MGVRGLDRVSSLRAKWAKRPTREDVDELKGSFRDLREQFAALQSQVATVEARSQESWAAVGAVDGFLGRGVRFSDRVLRPDQIRRLNDQISPIAERDVTRELYVAYRHCVVYEALCAGRIAGSIANIVGKLTTARVLAPPDSSVLEIGTLFGIFAGALHGELSRGGTVHLTLIDPLEGVQVQPGRDGDPDPSGTPVTERVVNWNLKRADVSAEAYRILRGYSTDPIIRATAADRSYDVIIVDGDHSELGVLRDLEWAVELLAPGGVLLLDDYGDRMWPGVEAATQSFLKQHSECKLAGVVAATAFLVRGQ